MTDEEAKQAAAAADQADRLHRIETRIAGMQVSLRISLALHLVILAILLAPLFQ